MGQQQELRVNRSLVVGSSAWVAAQIAKSVPASMARFSPQTVAAYREIAATGKSSIGQVTTPREPPPPISPRPSPQPLKLSVSPTVSKSVSAAIYRTMVLPVLPFQAPPAPPEVDTVVLTAEEVYSLDPASLYQLTSAEERGEIIVEVED